MANKVSQEDILNFNRLYYECHNKAEVARQTGFSAATVSRYIDPNWTPIDNSSIIRFKYEDLPDFDFEKFKDIKNYGMLCLYSDEERREIEELWKELEV